MITKIIISGGGIRQQFCDWLGDCNVYAKQFIQNSRCLCAAHTLIVEDALVTAVTDITSCQFPNKSTRQCCDKHSPAY